MRVSTPHFTLDLPDDFAEVQAESGYQFVGVSDRVDVAVLGCPGEPSAGDWSTRVISMLADRKADLRADSGGKAEFQDVGFAAHRDMYREGCLVVCDGGQPSVLWAAVMANHPPHGALEHLPDVSAAEVIELEPGELGVLLVVGAVQEHDVEVRVEAQVGRGSLHDGSGTSALT